MSNQTPRDPRNNFESQAERDARIAAEQRARDKSKGFIPVLLGIMGFIGILGLLNFCSPKPQESTSTTGTPSLSGNPTPNGPLPETNTPVSPESNDDKKTDSAPNGGVVEPGIDSSPLSTTPSNPPSTTPTDNNITPPDSNKPDTNVDTAIKPPISTTIPNNPPAVDNLGKTSVDLDDSVFRRSFSSDKDYLDTLAKKASRDATNTTEVLKSTKLTIDERAKQEEMLKRYLNQAEIYGKMVKEKTTKSP